MKKLILLFAVLLVSFQSFGQKKSKVDPKDAQIDTLKMTNDTLKMTNKTLALKLDSVTKELVKYTGLYDVIKEKVLHYNFDPTRSTYLIDSLKATRDSSSLLLAKPKSEAMSDSVRILLGENKTLKMKIDSVRTLYEQNKVSISAAEMERAKALSSVKQLKELLDAKIIDDAEFVSLKKKYLEKL